MGDSTSLWRDVADRAVDAFARDVAGDSAIDSVVYDLAAYDAAVPTRIRYAAVTRDGLFGLYADPDVANMAVVNRHAYAKRVSVLEGEGLTTSDAQGVADVEFGAYVSLGDGRQSE